MQNLIFYDPKKSHIVHWWVEGSELIIEHCHEDFPKHSCNYVRLDKGLLWEKLMHQDFISEAISEDQFYACIGGREFLYDFDEFINEGFVEKEWIKEIFMESVEVPGVESWHFSKQMQPIERLLFQNYNLKKEGKNTDLSDQVIEISRQVCKISV